MSDPGGSPRPGRDSRPWPVLLAAVVSAAGVLTFLALVGPPDEATNAEGDSARPTADLSPSPTGAATTPPAPTPSTAATATTSASPSSSPAATRSASPGPPDVTPAAQPTPVPKRLPVVVFNQTTHRGLAAEVGEEIAQAGWTVVGVDNWVGTVPRTTVYHPDGYRRDAEALANFLGIDRVRLAVSPMRDDRLTVILMTDYVVK